MWKLDKRRTVERKTNYHKRRRLLSHASVRLVVRKTRQYLVLQIVQSEHARDRVLHSASTYDLLKHGWPSDAKGSLKSLSASYLAGYLLGTNAKGLSETVILDSGLIPSTKGSRVYAAVKGLSDAGITIPYGEEVVPSDEKIEGKDGKVGKEVFNRIKQTITTNGNKKNS